MAGMNEFLEAIHSVFSGNEVYSANFTKIISGTIKHPGSDYREETDEFVYLTKREKEVIGLIADGLSSKEIAEKLFLSIFTVKNHRKNILHKLGFKNSGQLIKYVLEKGLNTGN